MNWLQFISSLVSSLAWPAGVVAVVFILRRPLTKMLNARPVKSLKAGPAGIEVEYFDEKLQEVREDLGVPAPTQLPGETAGRNDFMDEMTQLAEVAPSAVILESFARLEKVLREAIDVSQGNGRTPSRPSSVRALARQAVEQGLITPSEFSAFEDVSVLRNLVAHAKPVELDAARALEYAKLVRQLIISISLAMGRTVEDGPIS